MWGTELYAFVNSADGDELLASCYGCCALMEWCLIHTGWETRWVLAMVAKINGSILHRE